MGNKSFRVSGSAKSSGTQQGSTTNLLDLLGSQTTEEPKEEEKKKGHPLRQGIKALVPSIASGFVKEVDSIADAPFSLTASFAAKKAERTGDAGDEFLARRQQQNYETYAKNTNALGDMGDLIERHAAEKQQKILDENPDSKFAQTVYKGTQLAESAGRMIPGMLVSAGVGSFLGAGEAATALTAAKEADAALKTAETAKALAAAEKTLNGITSIAENAGLASMWLGVYDSSVDDAIDQGWDMATASDKAFVDASLEVATEKMFGGIAGLREGTNTLGKAVQKVSEVPVIKELRTVMGNSAVGQAVASVSAKYVKLVEKHPRFFANWTGQTAANGVLEGEFSGYLGEAVEEMVSEFFGPKLQRMATGKSEEEIPDADLGQVLEAGLGGALLSIFMSPIGKVQQAVQATYEQRNNPYEYDSVPEGEFSVSKSPTGLPGVEPQMALPAGEQQGVLPQPGAESFRLSNEHKVRLANAIILDGWATVAEDTEAISSFIGYENAKQFKRIGALDEDLLSRIDLLEYKPGITTDAEVEEFLTKFSGLYKEQMLRNMRNYKQLPKDVIEQIVMKDESVAATKNQIDTLTRWWNDTARSLGYNRETMSRAQSANVSKKSGVKLSELHELQQQLKEALARASDPGHIEQLLKKANRDGTLESTYGEYVANEYHQFISDTEYAVITNEDGSQVSMNRDQYAAANYHGMDYAQLSGIGTYDLANEVEQVFNEYYEERRKKTYDPELRRQILDTVNRDLVDSGITDLKINFDESLIGTPTPARYRIKEDIIDLDPSVAGSVAKARFFIAHEVVHRAYSKLADNTSALEAFKRQMRVAMAASGHTYDEWYKALDSVYRKHYFNQAVKDITKRDPSISKENLLKSAKKIVDYRMTERGDLAEEETLAKFSAYMFSANGFAYSLASTNKEVLATVKALVDQSVLKDSPFRDFAEAQEQVSQLIADAINRDVSAAENIFTEKEDFSIRRPHPDYFYDGVNESDRRYSKMLRVAEEKLTDNILKSLKTGEKIENFLLNNGVTVHELEAVGVADYIDENPGSTAEDVLAYISAAQTQLTRVIRNSSDTYYDEKSSQAERGYRNYREIEYQYPVTGDGTYSGNHYDAETVFHARVTDALTKDGKKFLFIDEMQSDPHNAAVKAGRALGTKKPFYFTDGAEHQINARLSELREEHKANQRRLTAEKLSREDRRALEDRQRKLSEQIENLGSVPSSDTPYKKGWLKYALRDLCDLAVAEGYDGIAWISPEKTRDRYYPKRIRYTSNEAKQSLKAYKIEYGQEVPKFFNAASKRWGTSIESILFQVFPGEAYVDEEISTGDFYSSPDIAGGEAQDNYAGFGNLAEYEMSKKYGGQVYVDFLANFHNGKQKANGDYTWTALVIDEETEDTLGEFKVTSNFPDLDKTENRSRRFQGIYLTDAMRTDISENGQERFNISFRDGYEMPDSIAQLYEEAGVPIPTDAQLEGRVGLPLELREDYLKVSELATEKFRSTLVAHDQEAIRQALIDGYAPIREEMSRELEGAGMPEFVTDALWGTTEYLLWDPEEDHYVSTARSWRRMAEELRQGTAADFYERNVIDFEEDPGTIDEISKALSSRVDDVKAADIIDAYASRLEQLLDEYDTASRAAAQPGVPAISPEDIADWRKWMLTRSEMTEEQAAKRRSTYGHISDRVYSPLYNAIARRAPGTRITLDLRRGRGAQSYVGELAKYLLKSQVSPEEIKFSGLLPYVEMLQVSGDKTISREELLDFLYANEFAMAEKGRTKITPSDGPKLTQTGATEDPQSTVFDHKNDPGIFGDGDETLFHRSQWFTEGGSDYVEVEDYIPGNPYRNTHWAQYGGDDEGVVVHRRESIFETEAGEKVLLIDEIQSDAHTHASEAGGYYDPEVADRPEFKPYKDALYKYISERRRIKNEVLSILSNPRTTLNMFGDVANEMVLEGRFSSAEEALAALFSQDGGYRLRDRVVRAQKNDRAQRTANSINRWLFSTEPISTVVLRRIRSLAAKDGNSALSNQIAGLVDNLHRAETSLRSSTYRFITLNQALLKESGLDTAEPFVLGDKMDKFTGEILEEEAVVEPNWESSISKKVPDMPYKSQSSHIAYSAKRALQDAIDAGCKYVAWTTGQDQEGRWYGDTEVKPFYKRVYDEILPSFYGNYIKQFDKSSPGVQNVILPNARGQGAIGQTGYYDASTGEYIGDINHLGNLVRARFDLSQDVELDMAPVGDEGWIVYRVDSKRYSRGEAVPENQRLMAVQYASRTNNRGQDYPAIEITPAVVEAITKYGQSRFDIAADGVLDAETQALYEEAYGGRNTENPSDVLFKNSTSLDSEFQKLYEETGQKYGTMKDTDIPNQVTDTSKVSKFTRNVATDQTITPQMSDELKRIVMEGATSYTPLTDRASEAAAQRRLKRYENTDAQGRIAMDYSRAADDYMENSRNGKNNTKTDVVAGELLLRNIGSRIALQGDNVDPGLLNLWSKMVGALSVDATRAGQTTQAFSMLKKLTPEGRLYYIQRSIETLKEDLENAKMDLLGSAKKQAKALEGYEIPEELLKALSAAQTAQELDDVEQRIVDDIVGHIPPTLVTRAVAWRYLAMLGNLRTHERNCISNAANLVATGIANRLSGVAQDIFLKDNAERTATRTKASAEVKEFAKNDWETCMQIIYEQGGKTTGFDTKIEQGMRNFGRNAVGDKMEGLYNFNNKWLTREDSYFGGLAFRRAMESYITANHIDIAQFSGEAGRSKASLELLGKIRSYAMQEANRATYHEANALATALNKLEKESPLGALLVGGIAPFKKTPLNVLKQGAMYTGGGIIKGTYQLMNQVPSGQVTAAEAINNICTGMTGTMLIALGMFLKGAGMLKGGGSDDDREEYYDEMVGYQKYSLTIGNYNMTIDWLTPISMPLFAGVSVMEAMERLEADGDEQAASVVFTDMLGALGTAFDPLTNLSLLSGINDAMSSYSNNNKLMQLGLSAAESYATQFIPTLAGQVARTIDQTRRTTYAPKDSEYWGGTEMEKFVNRLKSKIPGLSYQNEAYIDMWGREENRSDNILARAVGQIFVPWYSKTVQSTEVDDRLAEVFAEAKTSTVLPATPNSYYTIDGETYYMSAEDYTMVKELVGKISYNGVKSLFDSTLFDRIGTDRRADVISDVYTFSRAYAKAAYAEKNSIPLKVDSSIGKVQAALDAGLTIGDYFIIKKLIGEFAADKDQNGKSISGSKKKKQVNLLNELGLSAEQQKVFLE